MRSEMAERGLSGRLFNIFPGTFRGVQFLLLCTESSAGAHLNHVLQQAGARGPPEILCGHSREKVRTLKSRERKLTRSKHLSPLIWIYFLVTEKLQITFSPHKLAP